MKTLSSNSKPMQRGYTISFLLLASSIQSLLICQMGSQKTRSSRLQKWQCRYQGMSLTESLKERNSSKGCPKTLSSKAQKSRFWKSRAQMTFQSTDVTPITWWWALNSPLTKWQWSWAKLSSNLHRIQLRWKANPLEFYYKKNSSVTSLWPSSSNKAKLQVCQVSLRTLARLELEMVLRECLFM